MLGAFSKVFGFEKPSAPRSGCFRIWSSKGDIQNDTPGDGGKARHDLTQVKWYNGCHCQIWGPLRPTVLPTHKRVFVFLIVVV